MRKVSVFVLAAIVAAAPMAQPALAQDKAAEVLAKMRQAVGGGRLDALKTFSLEATSARNMGERQLVTDIELYLDLPDKFLRVDNITAPIARTMTSGFNGDKLIMPAGMAGAPGAPMVIMNGAPMGGGAGMQRMTVEVMAGGGGDMRGGGPGGAAMTPEQRAMMAAGVIRSQRVELSRMMLGWFGTAHPGLKATYTYEGEAESPDGKAHIIGVKADGGFDARLFIDQATNLPLMVSYRAPEPIRVQNMGRPGAPANAAVPPPPPPPPGAAGAHVMAPPPQAGQPAISQDEMQKQIQEAMKNRKMIEYRVYFADWKDADGIQFPHTLQRATGNETTEEWTIARVKINPKIDAKKFQ